MGLWLIADADRTITIVIIVFSSRGEQWWNSTPISATHADLTMTNTIFIVVAS